MECESKYCFNYGKGLFFCNCRIAERKGSGAFVNQCRANRKMKEDAENENKELKELFIGI